MIFPTHYFTFRWLAKWLYVNVYTTINLTEINGPLKQYSLTNTQIKLEIELNVRRKKWNQQNMWSNLFIFYYIIICSVLANKMKLYFLVPILCGSAQKRKKKNPILHVWNKSLFALQYECRSCFNWNNANCKRRNKNPHDCIFEVITW